MKVRFTLIAVILSGLISPVSSEELLRCADTKISGFKWETNKNSRLQQFTPERFTVHVFSETVRIVHWDAYLTTTKYTCKKSVVSEHYHCTEPDGFADMPIVFGPEAYTRAVLKGSPSTRSSADSNIILAYGACSKI
jgi:hypothetical protein